MEKLLEGHLLIESKIITDEWIHWGKSTRRNSSAEKREYKKNRNPVLVLDRGLKIPEELTEISDIAAAKDRLHVYRYGGTTGNVHKIKWLDRYIAEEKTKQLLLGANIDDDGWEPSDTRGW
jgi:hypothetical protein